VRVTIAHRYASLSAAPIARIVSGMDSTVVPPTPAAAPLHDSTYARTQLLVDMRVAFILVNDARLRVLTRLFGTTQDEANLVTLMALLVAGQAARARLQRLPHFRFPPAGDVMLFSGSAREVARSVAGPTISQQPAALTLISMALMYGPTRRAIPKALLAASGAGERLTFGFRHRYGYLVDPGQRRARRAQQRREAQAAESVGGDA
jgi:hypothetical protein